MRISACVSLTGRLSGPNEHAPLRVVDGPQAWAQPQRRALPSFAIRLSGAPTADRSLTSSRAVCSQLLGRSASGPCGVGIIGAGPVSAVVVGRETDRSGASQAEAGPTKASPSSATPSPARTEETRLLMTHPFCTRRCYVILIDAGAILQLRRR
jgi:hypothetical protein